MTERARLGTSPGRFGLTDAHAEDELRAAGLWGRSGPIEGAEPILLALSRAPDPDLALRALDRIRTALADEDWAELAAALREDRVLRARWCGVLGGSSAFGDFLVANPQEWRRLTEQATRERPWPDVAGLTGELLLAVRDPEAGRPEVTVRDREAVRALRTAYRGLLLEIAAADFAPLIERDLPAVSYETVAARLSDLAVAALRAACAVAATEVLGGKPAPCELSVIAMGKCGGRELNYVSDVDVVFVAEPVEELSVATRLASTMMRIAGEACFEVDASLRPEGKAGALVRTLDGHLSYYRRWARTWEFQALLKARPVAGVGDGGDLGERYLAAVQPLVWTAADREHFVPDVRSMRRRVEEHLPAEHAERELKLGRGGLRDVEFAVQLLQLVHGRTDETLHDSSTLAALAALGAGGYVGRTDAVDLAESYAYLRLLEHRLQLQRLLRTHLFPAESETAALRWLARSIGLRSDGRRSAERALLTEFRRHGNRVRRLHEKLFYRPLLEAVARVPTEALRLTAKAAEARLSALGYASPEGALQHIQALTTGVSRRAAIQGALLPVLLDLLANTADPDGGLLAYRRVSEALSATPWYLRLLRDEGAVVDRLAVLLGTAKLVPDLLVRAPEVLPMLAHDKILVGKDPAEVATGLRSAVARQPDSKRAVAAARSLRRQEMLRVACADLLGLAELPLVCAALSSVWVAVLQAALDAAEREITGRNGGRRADLAVIGMGRLGGGELGYGSDADVLFVCRPINGAASAEAVRYATSVAELVRTLLGAPSQDPALQVDTDLRPEGRSGQLTRTLSSYHAYYTKWAEPWEAQALVRARFVAGNPALGAEFEAMIDPIRYPAGGLDLVGAREIRRIKARVDAERLPRGADPALHTKLGRGGLADIEWTLQLLQLQHAHAAPDLRTTSTRDGLAAAVRAGVLDAVDARELDEGWTLAMRARNAVTLVRGKPMDLLPGHGRELNAVAAALGYPASADPGEFLDDYLRVTRRARAVVERVFYES